MAAVVGATELHRAGRGGGAADLRGGGAMILAKDGISVDLPRGWEGRAFVPAVPAPALTYPVLHAATFALPHDDSSFGGGLARAMGAEATMFSLVEFDPALAGEKLFRGDRLPIVVRPADLSPGALQVRRPGHAGVQRFFAESRRAFCLYAIVGSRDDRSDRVRQLNGVLATLRIEPLHTPPGDG
jgi:hypothetical protein